MANCCHYRYIVTFLPLDCLNLASSNSVIFALSEPLTKHCSQSHNGNLRINISQALGCALEIDTGCSFQFSCVLLWLTDRTIFFPLSNRIGLYAILEMSANVVVSGLIVASLIEHDPARVALKREKCSLIVGLKIPLNCRFWTVIRYRFF